MEKLGSAGTIASVVRARLALGPLQSSRLASHRSLLSSHIRPLHTTRTAELHSTRRPEAAAPSVFETQHEASILERHQRSQLQPVSIAPEKQPSPLSKLSTTSLLRSLVIQQASSVPSLLRPSIAVLSYLATAQSAFTSPDRNPILKYALKALLYSQFCAGENSRQVSATAHGLKTWGVQGIMLCWAREVEFRKEKGVDIAQQLETQLSAPGAKEAAEEIVREWGRGSLETVKIASPGDIVALKFSGAGPLVLSSLLSPRGVHSPLFLQYLHEVCKLAKSRGVMITIDAEQQRFQDGIDAIVLSLSRLYNGSTSGAAVIYNTYQLYLKAAPAKLSADLKLAAAEGWTLGAKLVRGAYLASEQREVIWDTKEATDAAYDGVSTGLMKRNWTAGGYLNGSGAFPNVDCVLATHNLPSVEKAVALRQKQAETGQERIKLVFAQLMGMADDVSAAAIEAGQKAEAKAARSYMGQQQVDIPKVYKYLVWGSVQECMRYLVRRAEENRDAATRTKESRAALWSELKRRVLWN